MRPTWMLWRRVKSDVAWTGSNKEDAERLNGAIQVHVKDGILIMPQPGFMHCHLVTDEENTIVTRIGLDLGHCCTRIRPGLDSSLHSHGVTGLVKYEIGRPATDRKLLIGEIVKHVAFSRVRLAPRVLMRGDVGCFAIIRSARILSWDQVSHVGQDPVRHTIVVVAAVVVGGRGERSRERIDPRARPDLILVAVQA